MYLAENRVSSEVAGLGHREELVRQLHVRSQQFLGPAQLPVDRYVGAFPCLDVLACPGEQLKGLTIDLQEMYISRNPVLLRSWKEWLTEPRVE